METNQDRWVSNRMGSPMLQLHDADDQGLHYFSGVCSSALPANALVLESYKSNNPVLLRRRSPTIVAAKATPEQRNNAGPEIVEPCYIDETAEIHPSAKIGPNVSIGAGVKIGFGARVKDSIILDNTILEVS